MLQDVLVVIDALRDVDRHDEREVDRLRHGRPRRPDDERQDETENQTAGDRAHRIVMPSYCGAFAAMPPAQYFSPRLTSIARALML